MPVPRLPSIRLRARRLTAQWKPAPSINVSARMGARGTARGQSRVKA